MGHANRPVWYTLTDRAEAALADQHPGGDVRYVRPEDGEKLPGDLGGLGLTRPEWHQLLNDLLELNRHGALGGIRAIVAQRIGQTRRHMGGNLVTMARTAMDMGDYDQAAALLAAEIDQQAAP